MCYVKGQSWVLPVRLRFIFLLRVKLRQTRALKVPVEDAEEESGGGDVQLASLGTSKLECEERDFSWQEKVFSPREVCEYQDPSNCRTALEEKYHQDVMAMSSNEVPTNRLFSCVDADSYVDSKEISYKVTTDSKERPSFLVEKMAGLRLRKNTAKREVEAVQDHVTIEETYIDQSPLSDAQVMYIMADLNPKSGDYHDKRKEHVLCRLEYNSKGILIIYPDFNVGKAGYKIELDSITRDVYEYWLEHTSGMISDEEKTEEKKTIEEVTTEAFYNAPEKYYPSDAISGG